MLMKTKSILSILFVLCLLIGGVGCDDELSENELMRQKLIGTWEWTVSYGGVVGESKPQVGEKLEIGFIDNRVLITHNMENIDNQPPVITDKKIVIQDGSYFVSKEKNKYYLTITPKEETPDLYYLSGKREFYINKSGETLTINDSQGTAQFSSDYKKIN